MTATTINWPALFLEALADIKANKPLPPAVPLTEAEIQALLAAMQADLPAAVAQVQAHPGLITAFGRVLTALMADGHPSAGTLKAVIYAIPGGLASAEQFLPTVSGLITEFSPAPGKFIGIA